MVTAHLGEVSTQVFKTPFMHWIMYFGLGWLARLAILAKCTELALLFNFGVDARPVDCEAGA